MNIIINIILSSIAAIWSARLILRGFEHVSTKPLVEELITVLGGEEESMVFLWLTNTRLSGRILSRLLKDETIRAQALRGFATYREVNGTHDVCIIRHGNELEIKVIYDSLVNDESTTETLAKVAIA